MKKSREMFSEMFHLQDVWIVVTTPHSRLQTTSVQVVPTKTRANHEPTTATTLTLASFLKSRFQNIKSSWPDQTLLQTHVSSGGLNKLLLFLLFLWSVTRYYPVVSVWAHFLWGVLCFCCQTVFSCFCLREAFSSIVFRDLLSVWPWR